MIEKMEYDLHKDVLYIREVMFNQLKELRIENRLEGGEK